MTESQIKNSFFLIMPWLLILLELMIFALMHSHQIYLLLIFVIITMNKHDQAGSLINGLLAMTVLSYLETPIIGSWVLFILPTIVLGHYVEKRILVKWIIPYLLLAFAILLKIVMGSYLLHQTISWNYCTQIFFYNLIVLKIYQSTTMLKK